MMEHERLPQQLPPPQKSRPRMATESPSVPSAGSRVVGALPYGTAVQCKGAPTGDDVHRLAGEGVRSTPGSLPYGERIQTAFGRHDVSAVQAHVGGPAAAAAGAIGASAYAMGDQVAFREAPSLHTAAHEAAHVVQQRGGVQLKGGVGAAGDAYEQHADAVADAVVAGATAEPLLDRMSAGGPSAAPRSGVVQRHSAQAPAADVSHGHPENPAAVIKTDTIGPDGVRRLEWDDGETAVIQPNGDTTWYRPDGSFGGSVKSGGPDQGAGVAPPVAGDTAAAAAAPPPGASGNTGGDQFREALFQAAQKWLKSQEEFMSQAAIDKVRENPRDKNYSTCKDFVSKVLGEARGATGEKQDLSQMVTALNVLLDSEIGLRATVEADKKSAAMFDPEIARVQAEIAELNKDPKGPGVKARHLQKYVDSMIATRTKREAKTAKDQAALDKVAQSARGFVRATPGMPASLRPKKGDIIRIVTAETKEYAVAGAAGAVLQKGSFLHTAVLDRIDNVGQPNELWHTIDGGGSKATDGLTGAGTTFDPATLRFGRNAIEGWIDVAELVNGNAGATPGQTVST